MEVLGSFSCPWMSLDIRAHDLDSTIASSSSHGCAASGRTWLHKIE